MGATRRLACPRFREGHHPSPYGVTTYPYPFRSATTGAEEFVTCPRTNSGALSSWTEDATLGDLFLQTRSHCRRFGFGMNAKPALPVHCAYDQLVRVADLKPHPKNPNTHSAAQVAAIAAVIEGNGWRAPITVSNRSGFITRG